MSVQKHVFVENTWYAAAWEYEVAEADNRLARTICETPLVFYKSATSGYVALDNRCCHRAAPLSIGRVEGDCIRCMYHGLLYNPDGKVIEIPGQDHIADSMRVRSYPLAVSGGMIWIWMGDPELADESQIYHFAPLSEPENWRGYDKGAYMYYDANWLLIVDNLADFSHVAFVHTNTLGGAEEYAYNTVAENVEKSEDGFSMERWDRNSMPAPFHKKVIPGSEHSMPVDRCNKTEMRIPGVFLMETVFGPAGWGDTPEDRSACREYRNCQYMTPETRNTTHFFWNYLRNFDMDNPAATQSLQDSLLEGFLEDKIFIEEQQKLLAASPDFAPKAFHADTAFTHFRHRWRARLDQQDETSPLIIKENKRRIL